MKLNDSGLTTICLSERTSSLIGEYWVFIGGEAMVRVEVERLRLNDLCLSEHTFPSFSFAFLTCIIVSVFSSTISLSGFTRLHTFAKGY